MLNRRQTLFALLRSTAGAAGLVITLSGCSDDFRYASSFVEKAALGQTARTVRRPDFMFFRASIGAEYVVPPVKSTAGGSMDATLYTDTGVLEWRVSLARMSGPPTQAAFHGPATERENAPATIVLPTFEFYADRGNSWGMQGRSTLTAAQMEDLIAERWYVSASTAMHSDGELRGQIKIYRGGVHGV